MKIDNNSKQCKICTISFFILISAFIGYPFAYLIKLFFPIDLEISFLSILIGGILLLIFWLLTDNILKK